MCFLFRGSPACFKDFNKLQLQVDLLEVIKALLSRGYAGHVTETIENPHEVLISLARLKNGRFLLSMFFRLPCIDF